MNSKEKLGLDENALKELGAYFTATEIVQQPNVWLKIWREVKKQEKDLISFLEGSDYQRVILTGAGTSAYIGYSALGTFKKKICTYTESISTTDIVSHPENYLTKDIPTLLVSFSRSGNSPESVAAMELADKLVDKCHHLIITCNEEGKAALYTGKDSKYVFVLPSETNDRSLAMTSSYSGMLISSLLIASIREIDAHKSVVDQLAKIGEYILQHLASDLQEIAGLDFKRAVFLGAGSLYGTAKEAHLKLQELTDGKVVGVHDSFLGFRHGPKSVVDEETIVFYLFSGDDKVLRYERDLVKSMEKGTKAMLEVGIFPYKLPSIAVQKELVLNAAPLDFNEEFMCVPTIVVAQVFAFYKSLQEGLSPDNPSKSGAISRVVEGVIIYN